MAHLKFELWVTDLLRSSTLLKVNEGNTMNKKEEIDWWRKNFIAGFIFVGILMTAFNPLLSIYAVLMAICIKIPYRNEE